MKTLEIKYDYSGLRERMDNHRYSQHSLAKAVSIGRSSLNLKLNNRGMFTQSEIIKIADVLEIPANEIGKYFFKVIVQKTVQSKQTA